MARLKTLMSEILLHDQVDHSAFRSDLQDEIISRYNLVDVLKETLDRKSGERVKHLAICSVLCAKAPHEWFVESVWSVKENKTHGIVKDVLEFGYVPCIKSKEHYCFDKEDFEGVANRASTVLSIFNIILEKFSNEMENKDIKEFLSSFSSHLLFLVLEHKKENLWTTELSKVMAKNLFRLIKLYYQCDDDKQLLCHSQSFVELDDSFKTPDKTLMNSMLRLLMPKLTKETWKQYPSAKHVFQWCLFNKTYPNLYDFLEGILPPSLNFVDDFVLENRILGIQCLQHIMENVTAEQLRWYGHADVIYQALKHQLYTNEADLNEVSFPAILTILNIVEKLQVPGDHHVKRKTEKHDEIIQIILLNAECENKIVLRQIVTKFLGDFVDLMGITAVKHLERTLKLVESFLEVFDGQGEITRINVLVLLEKVMKNTWPRIPAYTNMILKMLLKFICCIAIQDSDRTETTTLQLVDKVTTCLKLLKMLGGKECEKLLQSVESSQLPPLCVKVINDVQYSVECTG